jgi:hypothetical protein
VNEHKCASSSWISYGNANQAWVAQKALHILFCQCFVSLYVELENGQDNHLDAHTHI